jgi:hypothetical protein
MAGVDSAGLGEVLQNVLASFSVDDRGLLVQVRHAPPSPPRVPLLLLPLPALLALLILIILFIDVRMCS